MNRYAVLGSNGVVACIHEVDNPHLGERDNYVESATAQVGQQWDGENFVEYTPTIADLKPEYEQAVQAHIDSVARAQGYDSIYTAISYLGSSDPKWAAEAVALRDWRDSVWLTTHTILNDVVAGERPLPTIEQAIAELPEYEQPEVL